MKRYATLLLVLSMVLALVACGGKNSPAGTTDDITARDDVVLSLNADPQTFDPVSTSASSAITVMMQIYDTLIHVNNDFEVEPRLAEAYTISDDGTTYTFELAKNVKFHNGETMTPEDVVFSINRALESPYTAFYVDSVDSVEAVGDNSVAIHLGTPDASFLEKLQIIMIVNEKAVNEAGAEYANNPVGTGPYKFKEYKPGVEVSLTRFDDYYRGAARIKDVTYKVITDINTATVNLRTGNVDAGSFAKTAYDAVKNEPNLTVVDWNANSIYYFAVNHEVAPFNNRLVRQALNYAIDREYVATADVETSGLTNITSVMLPPTVFGYSDDLDQTYVYDPAKAKELLEQAGIETPIDIGTIKIPEGDGKDAAQALQQCLAEIGLNTKIEMLELNKFFDETDFGDYEIAWCQISLLRDADSYSAIFTSNQIDGLNTARYNNPEVDELFTRAKAETDSNERLKLYTEVFNIINEDAVYIPLYVPTNVFAYNKDLKIDVIGQSIQFVYDMHWN